MPLQKEPFFALVLVLYAHRLSAFKPCTAVPPRLSSTPRRRMQQLRLARGPLDGFRKIVDSAAANVMDYITMQPSRSLPPGFRRVPTQFIAALGSPTAKEGVGAEEWGLWTVDPGPRGVFLSQYDKAIASSPGGRAPAGWTFDPSEFWIEEYGRIMEPPTFPIPEGRYFVTGGRATTSVLTIDAGGSGRRWKLDGGATLYDVTHLPCRAARYRPTSTADDGGGGGSPAAALLSDFPVRPGATMPRVRGCAKQDYAVLFVIGVEDE